MADAILTLNAGSSSIKFALFELGEDSRLDRAVNGQIEDIESAPHFRASSGTGDVLSERGWSVESGLKYDDFLDEILTWVDGHLKGDQLIGVGHRIVHGGTQFTTPTALDASAIAALERLSPLAPLHQLHNLSAVRATAKLRPKLTQIGCFDTAFHRTIPPLVSRFALPLDYEQSGVRRYGFHGLSYEYIAGRLVDVAPALADGRVIVAHLGNGASLCALQSGKSVDTTMGFTTLDGVPMGTRCGEIDPGVVLYLLQERRMDAAAIEDLFYHHSGLLGLSGLSADMRVLLKSTESAATEAVDLFVFRVAREIAALAATLGGLDGLVFTAGIGEHAPEIRQKICARASWLGVKLDDAANRNGKSLISDAESAVSIWVIPTDEEAMIARHTLDCILSRC